MWTLIIEHILNLTFLAALTLVAAGTGNLILHQARIPFFTSGERIFFATGAGFGVLSTSIFFLGAFHLLNPVAVYGLLAVSILSAMVGWRWFYRAFRNERPRKFQVHVLDRWAGVRPRARSRAPMLGAWPGRPGHFVANGGFKIGFGMAPKVAEVMADLVLAGRDAIPEGFRVEDNL